MESGLIEPVLKPLRTAWKTSSQWVSSQGHCTTSVPPGEQPAHAGEGVEGPVEVFEYVEEKDRVE